MPDNSKTTPDNTAVRTALWRALHVDSDAPPHVFEDVIGLRLRRRSRLAEPLVPVDFEVGDVWLERLAASGFNASSRRWWRRRASART